MYISDIRHKINSIKIYWKPEGFRYRLLQFVLFVTLCDYFI